MSNYGSGMGMIFTNSGKQTGKQAPVIQAPVIRAQSRSFQPIMNAAGRAAGGAGGGGGGAGTRGFRTMDLGNLKTNKSCGSCGH